MAKKILIVEDDKDFLWLLRQGFEGEDLTVIYSLDGEDGLAMAEKENPDLIMIDILLPKMDGITMAKKMVEKGIKAPKMFLTNFKDEEHISQAMEALGGGADYIIKSDLHIDEIVERAKKKMGAK